MDQIEEKRRILEELEQKNVYSRLKRWEKQLMKKLRNFINYVKQNIEIMEKQKKEFNQEIKKENVEFERLSREKTEEKNKELNKIEDNKNEIINKNEKKYSDIISYLETIKNDKEKLIEFFNKSDLLYNL